MRLAGNGRTVVTAALVATALSCSGGSSPSAPAPAPAPSATAAAPSPSPSAAPSTGPTPSTTACRFGMGSPDTFCIRKSAALIGNVDAAIDAVVQQHPTWFNVNDINGPGGYKVLNQPDYYNAVVANLQAAGMCAETDTLQVSVRDGSEFSEDYDILLGTGHIRRGDGSYRQTCTPPSFPLDLSQLISYVRVAFYSIRCPDGVAVPRNGDGKLPVGCTGLVTATAKTKDNLDVNPALVGNQIDWTLQQDGDFLHVSDFPEVAFNKIAFGANAGPYALCAQIKTYSGCLYGEVSEPTPAQ